MELLKVGDSITWEGDTSKVAEVKHYFTGTVYTMENGSHHHQDDLSDAMACCRVWIKRSASPASVEVVSE